ncbi:hypothetical protein Dsin_018190 [Dipteronia sinensis]|uniref:Reverse transcriptase domain-containing protein n=1 Tax=Dipteronia sinensis TaxID=43782 RepID=A0AAE0A5Q6_9ROSI|nr:hypothetical protein Dsin_018190 [Dipteronia sinensis]
MCSVLYKIITKTMANRLKVVLPEIIDPCQSAFVPGRLIFDNVLCSFELLHSITHRKKWKVGWAAIKLDLSKAYDRVEWKFLEMVLKKLGFSQRWVSLVMECISTSSLSFVINGKVKGQIFPSRRIRQGCPISLYLFFFCAELFSHLLKQSEYDGKVLGVRICKGNPLISHLFFTDKCLLFCRASVQSGVEIKNVLVLYEKASGQQVNLQKSGITFSPNTAVSVRKEIQLLFGLATVQTHDMYLGLPYVEWRFFKGVNEAGLLGGVEKYFVGKGFASEGPSVECGYQGQHINFRGSVASVPFLFLFCFSEFEDGFSGGGFIDKHGLCWNLRRLEEYFLEVDRELILAIPISIGDKPDCWMWHFDKKGIYNVKSGYRVACDSKLRALSSSSVQKGEWWKLLWNLHVPPKVRVFLWKVSNNAIPSLENLFRRKVNLVLCCGRCEEEVESTSHALFWCTEVEKVWEFTEFGLLLGELKGLGCLEILCWFSLKIDREAMARFAMVLWGIWFNRNQLVHNKEGRDSDELFSWSAGGVSSCSSLGGNSFGIGAVIRDFEGKVVLALSKFVQGCFSVEVCEALALREGLSLAKQHGLFIGWAEVDASSVAAGVNSSESSRGVACFVFDDIATLCKEVRVSECKAISRCGNGVAHNLASLAVSSIRDHMWQGHCSSSLFSGC